MQKMEYKAARLEHARTFFSVVFFAALCVFNSPLSNASGVSGSIPLPPTKPVFEQTSTQSNLEIVKYSLQDFAKALLDFGGPPVPTRKPFSVSEEPFSREDIARYKTIFDLQAEGKMDKADEEIQKLTNLRLRGHVLYQRYLHPTAYTSNFEELRNWLALYADHAGATKIYALAERKKPADFDGKLTQPRSARGVARVQDPMMRASKTYRSDKPRSEAEQSSVKAFQSAVQADLKKGELAQALSLIKTDKRFTLLDDVEQDLVRARVAAAHLYAGEEKQAHKLAAAAAKRSSAEAPLAGWIAGLSSWHQGKFRDAAKYFEIAASSPYASGWTASAGSYWAARSHMRRGNVKAVSKWLHKAMEYPRTFYGLVATRALGRDFEFNWNVPTFTKDYHEVLRGTSAGMRAMDLISVGQIEMAEAELLRVNPGRDHDMRTALLAYAGYAELPALSLRLGSLVSAPAGHTYDAALYPKGGWEPKSGYKIDPALVHAIMRQESRFDPLAKSHTGARGLMQLMPKTARYVAKKKDLSLDNPETNLEIGQQYLGDLLETKYVDHDLLSLLIAYNAGPGNLSRWHKQWSDVKDPLLFIELIPSGETRNYVERVLSNYWIYRLREGLPTPTLDAVVEGRKAHYAYDPDGGVAVAKNG